MNFLFLSVHAIEQLQLYRNFLAIFIQWNGNFGQISNDLTTF